MKPNYIDFDKTLECEKTISSLEWDLKGFNKTLADLKKAKNVYKKLTILMRRKEAYCWRIRLGGKDWFIKDRYESIFRNNYDSHITGLTVCCKHNLSINGNDYVITEDDRVYFKGRDCVLIYKLVLNINEFEKTRTISFYDLMDGSLRKVPRVVWMQKQKD